MKLRLVILSLTMLVLASGAVVASVVCGLEPPAAQPVAVIPKVVETPMAPAVAAPQTPAEGTAINSNGCKAVAAALERVKTRLDERRADRKALTKDMPTDKIDAEIATLEELQGKLETALIGIHNNGTTVTPPEKKTEPVECCGNMSAAKTTGAAAPVKMCAAQPKKDKISPVSEGPSWTNDAAHKNFREKIIANLKSGKTVETEKTEPKKAVEEQAVIAEAAGTAAPATPARPAAPTTVATAPAPKAEVVAVQPRGALDVRAAVNQGIETMRAMAAGDVTVQTDFNQRPELIKTPAVRAGATPEEGPKYAGEWANGIMNGQGALTYADGRQYVGQWSEGKMNGLGQFIVPGQWQYAGEWRAGRAEGDGILVHSNGWKYAGKWHNGRREGQGTLICTDGWEYTGEWANGVMNGQGKLMRPGIGAYSGQWIEGKRQGQGTLNYADGATYVGAWHDDHREGQGVLSYPDGWRYDGQWAGDTLEGQGKLVHPDGWTYTGEWKQGRMSGRGELIYQTKGQKPADK